MINIIAGERRGAKLQTLEGMDTRPLRGRVRESMFNIIRPQLADAVVWDLFAGSGSVGLEALSQGASTSLFAEANPKAIKIIEQNIAKLRYEDRTRMIKGSLPDSLVKIPRNLREPDIIFIMPPYQSGLVESLMEELAKEEYGISEDTLIIIETHRREDETLSDRWVTTDSRKYGITRLTFYRKAPTEN